MTTSWGWIGPYFIVILLAVLVGPFLATLPLFTHTYLRPLGMNVEQVVRFIADGICLLMIWSTASRARRDLMDNGKGMRLEMQSNPLSICMRPKVLIQGKRGA